MKKTFVLAALLLSYYAAFASNIEVSGNITANTTWEPDTVFVIGNVTVDDGITLIVEPGVTVVANGFYSRNIQGRILAEGTEADSIKFTAADPEVGWNRIAFDSTPATNDESIFSFCIVEYGNTSENGGAFYVVYFHKLRVLNSSVRYCSGLNSVFYMYLGSADILDCNIYNNTSGYAILAIASNSTSQIANNRIHNNSSSGIYSGYSIDNEFTGNLIYENSGTGIIFYNSNSKFINNTIIDNASYGLRFINDSNDNFYNNIIYDNTDGEVILQNANCDPNFYYCDIEGGVSGFSGDGSGANYTGTYENNIDIYPLFVDQANFDYRLLVNSPCLDEGTPDTSGFSLPEFDLAGNNRIINGQIDIGAFEGIHSSSINPEILGVKSFDLKQNYPNPFNPITRINYELRITNYELAEIVVHNSVGQIVWSSLIAPYGSCATGFVLFDGSKFNSGVYYYSLIIDQKTIATKSMILLK